MKVMGKQIVGALMLVAGTATLLLGVAYVNTPAYRVMSVVNSATGGSDPAGVIAIVIGSLVAFVGSFAMLSGPSKRKKRS
jgi:hypothetical protein